MTEEAFRHRARSLEERFFAQKDAELIEKIRHREFVNVSVAELAAATGIADTAVLEKLAHVKISAETLTALSVIPLVEVAWADGSIADDERAAVLRAATESGIPLDGPGYRQLQTWLVTKPDAELLAAWKDYVAALAKQLSGEDYRKVRDNLLTRARQVAQAAGGYLGFGAVSPSENKVLDQLAAAFGA